MFINNRSDFKESCKNFHTFFHSVPNPSPVIAEADLEYNKARSSFHLSFGQQKKIFKEEQNKNMVIFRIFLWSSCSKLSSERRPLPGMKTKSK